MAAKHDYDGAKLSSKHADSKLADGDGDEPQVILSVLELTCSPSQPCRIEDPLTLRIRFDVDRDIEASYWTIKFLVDSCDRRIIRVGANNTS